MRQPVVRRRCSGSELALLVALCSASLAGCDAEPAGGLVPDVDSITSALLQPNFVPNIDGDNNNRDWASIPCGTGEFMVGISYKDMSQDNTDVMDGATPWCARPGQFPRRVLNGDIDANPRAFASFFCNRGDVVVGISYKDLAPNSDFADGVTLLCAAADNPGGTEVRIENGDLSDNPRGFADLRCDRGQRAVGIAYKDTPPQWGNSDYSDAITVLCE